MSASRPRLLLRRGLAVAVVAALAAAAWLVFARDGDDEPNTQPQRDRGITQDVDLLARGLTPSDQVDQVLLLGFEGSDRSAPFLAEVGARELGGVLLGSQNGADPALLRAVERAGRGKERIPPLLVAAQEGGVYRSFLELPPEERAIDIGDRSSAPAAQRWARQTAGTLRDLGFHLNLFPVADVATLDSPVGGRAFSDDAALTAELTAAALRGCREAELACAPLHFPGLGAASQDTAQGPATVSLDTSALAARDLEPFRAAVGRRAPAIVLSLAFYSAYDPVTPAALTPEVATGLLREELGFQGVAITDDLGAGAVTATYDVPEAAVAALRAGADLLQVGTPADGDRVRDALLAAAQSGELPEDRLTEAASRVLKLKRDLGLIAE